MEKRDFNDRPLPLREAAEFLGVSTSTLYKYVRDRMIPHFKVNNRKLYFMKEDLTAFILNDSNRVMSRDEIEKAATNHKSKSKKEERDD